MDLPFQDPFTNGIILYLAFVMGSYMIMFSINERSWR